MPNVCTPGCSPASRTRRPTITSRQCRPISRGSAEAGGSPTYRSASCTTHHPTRDAPSRRRRCPASRLGGAMPGVTVRIPPYPGCRVGDDHNAHRRRRGDRSRRDRLDGTDFDDVSGSVLDWLTAQAGDRDIEIHPNFAPQRIVFEEGEAIGVVFATPGGPLAVHARHGVTVGAGSPRVMNTPLPHQLSDGAAELRSRLVASMRARSAASSCSRRIRSPATLRRPADLAAVRCAPTYGRRAASHPHGVVHGERVIRRRGSSHAIAPRSTVPV